MGYFKMPSPRKFNHKYIYVDERRERLDKIVENAKRDLGMLPPESTTYEQRIKGAFSAETTHLKRRKERGGGISTKKLIVATVVALYLLHYLVTGSWTF